jgi:hypothetical protein
MKKNGVFHASNQVGKFANENHRFSSSLFLRLATLILI